MRESEPTDDGELLRRFRAGDREAFTRIYQLHNRAVFRFAALMTGDHVKAAEITQDVFVWLIHHPQNFDPHRGGLGAFLVGVARKLLKRRQNEELRWVPFAESGADVSFQPPADDLAQDVRLLRKAIGTLPALYRELVVLCDLEGKTYEEASLMVDCPVGTVRSRLHRARALLTRKVLGRGCPA